MYCNFKSKNFQVFLSRVVLYILKDLKDLRQSDSINSRAERGIWWVKSVSMVGKKCGYGG